MGLFGKKKKNEEFIEEYTPIGTDATLNDNFLDSFEDSRDVISLFGSDSKEDSLEENHYFSNNFNKEPIQRNNDIDGVEGKDVVSLFGNSNSLKSTLNKNKEENISSLFGSSQSLKKDDRLIQRNNDIDGVEGKDVASLFGNSNSLKSTLNKNKEENYQGLNVDLNLNEKSEAPKEIGTGDVASLFGSNNFLKSSLKKGDSSPKIDFSANEKSEAPKEIGTGDVASLFGTGGFNQLKKEPIKEENETKDAKDVASLFGAGGFNQLKKEPIKEENETKGTKDVASLFGAGGFNQLKKESIKEENETKNNRDVSSLFEASDFNQNEKEHREEKVNTLKKSSSLFTKNNLNNKSNLNNNEKPSSTNLLFENKIESNKKSIENLNIKKEEDLIDEVFVVGGTIKQFKIEKEDFSKNKNKKSFFKKNKNDLKEEVKSTSSIENKSSNFSENNDVVDSKIIKKEISEVKEVKEELPKEENIKKEPLKKSSSLFTSSKSLNLNKQDIFTKMNKQKEEEKIVAEKINNNTFISIDEYYGLDEIEEKKDTQEEYSYNEKELSSIDNQEEIILEEIKEEIKEEEIIRDFKNFVFDDDFDLYEKEHSLEYFTYDELIDKIKKEEEQRLANLGVDELLSEVLISNEDVESSHVFEDAKIVTDVVQVNKKEEKLKELEIIEDIEAKNFVETNENNKELDKEEDILSILGVNNKVESLPEELTELEFLDIFETDDSIVDEKVKIDNEIEVKETIKNDEVVNIVEQVQPSFNSNNSKYDFDIFSFLNASNDEKVQEEDDKVVENVIEEEIIEKKEEVEEVVQEVVQEESKNEETNKEDNDFVDIVTNEEPTIYDIMKDRRKDLIKSNDLKETINVVIEKKEEAKEEESRDKKEKEKRDSFIAIDEEVDAEEFKTKEIDYSKLNEEFNPYKGKTNEEIEELRKKSERQRDYVETGIHKVDKTFDTSIGTIVEFDDKNEEINEEFNDDSNLDEILKIMKQNEFILDEETNTEIRREKKFEIKNNQVQSQTIKQTIKKDEEIKEEKVEIPQIVESIPSPDIIAIKEEKAKVKTTSEFSNFSHELGKVNKINSITNEFDLVSKKINSINYNVFNDFTEFTINYRKLRNDYLDKKREKALREKQRLMKQLQEEDDRQKSLKSSQYDEQLNKALYSGKKQSTILGNISENSHDRLMRLRGDFSREEDDNDEIVFGRYKVKDASTSLSELNNRLPSRALYDEFIVDDFDYSEIEEPEPPNKNTFSGRGMRPPRQ